MKTSELIDRLRKADPTGDAECVVGSEDIYFVARQPMYYDGRPWLLVHDAAVRDKACSIIGLRYPESGTKVSIVTVGVESALYEHPDLPIECADEAREYVERVRAEVKAELAKD